MIFTNKPISEIESAGAGFSDSSRHRSRPEECSQTMPMPNIDKPNLRKPICYDPARKKFILFEEIVSGKEDIIPVEALSEGDLKRLVVERHRAGPDYKVQAISGPPLSRDDVILAIEREEPFGRMTLAAEKSYLQDLLVEIRQNLA